MPSPPQSYPDWKAPTQDGDFLIWPESPRLIDDLQDNAERFSRSMAMVQNVPLAELRRRMREFLAGGESDTPIILDGHQTELSHSGVWAKRVLADALARKVEGLALHVAVDTDAPKHFHLRWPGMTAPITDDPALTTAAWTGLLEAPSPRHVAMLMQRASESPFASGSMIETMLASLRPLALEQPKLAPALMFASQALDEELGLRDEPRLASSIWLAEPFLIYAHHLIARARDFANVYNRALAGYRKANRIRTEMRPMPDLASPGGSVELPFWLDELSTGQRTRPSVFPDGGGFLLASPAGEPFHFSPDANGDNAAANLARWLRQNQLRLSPRALTLTMFLRLFVADQFIHGIGGARYDQITNQIIADHFAIDPPAFCVTTATMYLPHAVGRVRVCVPCIEQEGHRLRHNLLGDRKRQYIERIESAPRCSAERYAAFTQMHHELAAAVKTAPQMKRWQESLREAQQRDVEEEVLFDRELFYALQPRARLMGMIERYRANLR
jgi:hypothetical protein